MPDFDVTRPHIARIYDDWLGGKDNSEADLNSLPTAMRGGVGRQ